MGGKLTGLTATLFERSEREPDVVAYTLLDNVGEEIDKITNIDLHKRALLIASEIQTQLPSAKNIILLFNKNSDFIPALFGTFYSGAIAILFPVSIDELLKVVKEGNIDGILTTRSIFNQLKSINLDLMKFIIYDEFEFKTNKNLIISSNSLALNLKGVLHSHSDLIKHLKRIKDSYGLSKEDRSLSWVPYHHYMGLFYGILQPFYAGIPAYVFSDIDRPLEPLIWLTAISKYDITFSGGTAFFYEMLLDKNISDKLNLSSWSVAYIGAEKISRDVIDRFIFKYQHYGFKKTAMYPSYGMAEAPLVSTGIYNERSGDIAGSGKKVNGIEIQIKDGEIGEIWISDQENIKTGDMGYIHEEVVYVLGKTKTAEKQESIAVIGLAGVFPQSDSCNEFWDNLENGRDLITEIPENRWDWKEIYGSPDNQTKKTDIKWGGFINDVEAFDASFFNISPKEAQLMDPMQRKLIQVVWQAVEDAGYRMSEYSGKKLAVVVGIGTFDYLQLILENNQFTHAYASTGVVHCMASNRISYLFNFKGPSESVDTACSSSLVALHRAFHLLRNNECEMAIVCGANIILSSSVYVALSNANMLSKSGKCRTFDDSADGYVRGEGVAALVLKKLSSSIADGDHIYGLIKGIAVNHGGHTSSLTAPNPFAQAEVIEDALKMASISSDTISYVETHGTATSLGDPIEINGLISAFKSSAKHYCALGSVKTNIGHLEAAAGIAGVIKVLLSMRHKKIPAHLHLVTQNKNIHLENSPFYLMGNTTAWENRKGMPRRAGVSSFGFGGVNAHVVLEEYQDARIDNSKQSGSNLFIFSAKTENALKRYIKSYCDFLEKNDSAFNLDDMAYTLQVGREPFDFRLAVIAHDGKDLLKKLTENSVYYGNSNIVFNSDLEEYYLSTNNLDYLAQLWILGANIDWHKLYIKKNQVRRISLPTYPFEKTYHWLSQIKDTYDVSWYEMPLSNTTQAKEGEYILFCDNQGVGKNFYNLLVKKNIKAHQIYYQANYLEVFEEIRSKSTSQTFYIVNFWPLDSNPEQQTAYQFACRTALEQIQLFASMQEQLTLHLWIVCANVQKLKNNKINLSCAPLWGMAKTLLLEHPSLFRAIIDINLNEEINVENLFDEINSMSEEGEVVYRQNTRYVSRLEPCQIEVSKNIEIKQDGIYLITGGLGALGLLVAEWLSSFKVKKIVLLSRRGLESGKKPDAIKRIESRGTEVEIVQADVTDLNQMSTYLKGIELRGVFHLAGSYKESLLQNMSFDEFESVVSAKVQGTWVLHEILEGCQLDWFVLFSSGASVWGAATGGHYSAGNYFLDAYTDYCEMNGRPAMSISWGGLWKNSGIIPKNKEEYFKSVGVKETLPDEGLRQLESIMNSNSRKKVVAPIHWPLFLEVMNVQRGITLFERLNTKSESVEMKNNDPLFITNLASCASENEKRLFILNELKKLVGDVLGIAERSHIEENIGFFDLGMDSLTCIDFTKKIKKLMGIKITTTTLFDCNTLQLLTNYFLTHHFQVQTKSEFDGIEKNDLLNFLQKVIYE
ncbi:MAG: KR domain-containing protein [Gammaproteobacteria bacterium]|nr:MAG: KR domain-containing protein [Gammaproteobacteria bacterium]